MSSAVELVQVSRHFGEIRAVDAVNIEIAKGEFFAMLGPSGSGKTTCLRLIAGFERADHGDIYILGNNVGHTPPYHRAVNTVFQDYALFPHLSVEDNVAYGLKIKGVATKQRRREAAIALEMVRLPDFGSRRPSELSGGQRQRVALARALINKPQVLLLDEPLGALDLKLREQMQEELKALQRELNITFVFVTHDQGEALSMADRLAVFNEGSVAQIGTPQDVYEKPQSRFVANFVGSSNLLPPEIVTSLDNNAAWAWASLRPEKIRLVDADGIHATVKGSHYLGGSTRLLLDMQGTDIVCVQPADQRIPDVGSTVLIDWDRHSLHVMTQT